ncbi:MAG TPA: chromate transporter [Paenibacillus sp.]|uniref:chromate transporter n=1 Tax=Paenibacillus sp. TaxID=58172 RepID=UPI0028CFDAB5|nr:chromate transporter [Paenibacillus sp.]HUC94357.1 chromate transporter [Paenibacillus sp.]
MTWIELFWAFFISNLLGYGGGPPIIPLLQAEVVDGYRWMTLEQFGDVLALGNALPSPIATKLAGYIGYQVAGAPGALIGLFATIVPTAAAMIALFKFIDVFKTSPQVTAMTKIVRPIVAVLMGMLAWQFLSSAYYSAGIWQTALLTAASLIGLERFKLHPALVIGAAMAYGAFFLG